MARWLTLSALILFVFLILLNEVDFSAGARGGRGGGRGGRGGRGRGGSRSSRSSGASRAYKGTYGMTRSTWKASFAGVTVYGGQRYLLSSRYRRHPDKMPTICRNNIETDSNGTVYNLFVCPRYNDPDELEYCCGEPNKEYCCKYFDSNWRIIVIVVMVVVVLALVGFATFGWWKGKICKSLNCCGKETPKPSVPKGEEMKEPGAPPTYNEATIYMTDNPAYAEPVYPEKSARI